MKKKNIIIYLIFLLIGITGIVFTLAKYTNVIDSSYSQTTSSFYFTSNYLTLTESSYQIYTDEIDIKLYNYDIQNINNISSSDITYNTSIKYYNSEDILIGSEVITTNNFLWENDTYGKVSVLTLTYIDGAEYAVVNVNSTAPYIKNITARFYFNFAEYLPTYSVNELTHGFTLKIMTSNEDMSSILVNWPSLCGPDNTNEYMSLWTTGSNSNYLQNLMSNTTYTLNFYCTLDIVYVNLVDNQIISDSTITITLE